MATTEIIVRLPGPPIGKGRPRFSRKSGVAYTPERTRSYEGQLKLAAETAMGESAPLTGALRVAVVAAFPIPESWSKKKRALAATGELRPCIAPDADNLLKVLDALNQVVFVDDKQIVDAVIRKVYSDRPCLTISVQVLA